ncbi:MAG: ScpA family protein [Alphaproteobacteria bacterium]
MSIDTSFEEPRLDGQPSGIELVLDLEGFEGPIDLLLTLAREQKVDLARISILQLADQYLEFIAGARALNLDIAAEYLVMAAWLAYLKSRLLLPEEEKNEDEPSGEEIAALLAFQLRRLEAMREAGAKLMALPQLGRDRFPRGEPQGLARIAKPIWQASLYDLLRAYGDHRKRTQPTQLTIAQTELYSIDLAIQRLSYIIGHLPDWATLASFLPAEITDVLVWRSAIAAHFVASLELTREGKLELRQADSFGPIWLRDPSDIKGKMPSHDVPVSDPH